MHGSGPAPRFLIRIRGWRKGYSGHEMSFSQVDANPEVLTKGAIIRRRYRAPQLERLRKSVNTYLSDGYASLRSLGDGGRVTRFSRQVTGSPTPLKQSLHSISGETPWMEWY